MDESQMKKFTGRNCISTIGIPKDVIGVGTIDSFKKIRLAEQKEVYKEILNKLNNCTKILDFSNLIVELNKKLKTYE